MAKITRIPWVLQEITSNKSYRTNLKNTLRIITARSARAIVANSWSGRQYWQSHLPHKKVHVIPNVLPIAEIEAVSAAQAWSHRQSPGERTILFVGRFDQNKYAGGKIHAKNLDNLVRALQLMSTPGFTALLCGDGPRMATIRQMVQELGLADRVRLPGFVEDAWSLMKLAEVFVSVSWFEGQPNTVMEAMACRCPVVVSDIPEHREFLDEDSAIFVNPGSPEDIARGLEQALADPAAARRRARRAQNRAKQWDVAVIAERHEAMYLEILDYHKP